MNTATYAELARKPKILEPGERVMCACGEPECFKAIEVSINMLIAYLDVSDEDEESIVIDLPKGYALVKYEIDGGPVPDWSRAPIWAQWWAVDPNGWAHWFQEEPVLALTVNYSGWVAKTIQGIQQGAELWAAEIDLDLGIDWRTLKYQRPQETQSDVS